MPVYDPFLLAPEILQVRALGICKGQQVIVTSHWRLGGNPVPASSTHKLSVLGLAIRARFRSQYLTQMSTSLTFLLYEVRIFSGRVAISDPPPPVPTVQWRIVVSAFQQLEADAVDDSGVLAGEILPVSSAVVLSLRTGFGGRGGNGNCRLCPIREADQADGQLTVTADNNWSQAGLFWTTAVAAGTPAPDSLVPVIFQRYEYTHRTTGGPSFPPLSNSIDIGAANVNTFIRTQRTRVPPLRVGN